MIDGGENRELGLALAAGVARQPQQHVLAAPARVNDAQAGALDELGDHGVAVGRLRRGEGLGLGHASSRVWTKPRRPASSLGGERLRALLEARWAVGGGWGTLVEEHPAFHRPTPSPADTMTALPFPLALLCLAPLASAGQVTTFVGPPGGIGDVRIAPEDGLAPATTVAGLAGVRLLPIDASGRSALTQLLPDQPSLRDDVAGLAPGLGGRIALPAEQGSLYRFRRDESGGAATFGLFLVGPSGAPAIVLELPGAGPAGDADPLLPRIGVDATGSAALVGTTVAAGGDLFELDLAAGTSTNRTSNLAPLTLDDAGGRLLVGWGTAVAQEGLVRFARTPGALAEMVAVPNVAAPAFWDGGIAVSADSSTAATVAGAGPTATHVICYGPSGDGHALDTVPAELKGAGFFPDSTAGPYLALSTDGSTAAYVDVRVAPGGEKKREAWMTPTAPQPGDAPQQITADGKFIDTLDETGLIGFVSGDTMVLGVGELGDPDIPGSTSIDGVDVYRVTLNAGGTTTITNLSLTSGDTTEPFTEGEISTEKGLFLLPGGDLLALNRQQEVLGRVDPSLPGLQPLLPQTKDVVSVHRAGGSLLVHVRHASASIDQRLHAYDIAGGTLTQFGSLPSGVVIERHALRSDGTAAFVIRLGLKEWLGRIDLANLTGALATPLPIVFGGALAFTPAGGLALTVGAPAGPAYQLVWTAAGGVALLPAPLVPAQVLPGIG